VVPSLKKFCVGGQIRNDNVVNPRARKWKTLTCMRGENAQIRVWRMERGRWLVDDQEH